VCKGSSVGRERLHRNSEVGYSEDLDILSSGVKGVHILIAATDGFPVGREVPANQGCTLILEYANPVGKALKRLEHRMASSKMLLMAYHSMNAIRQYWNKCLWSAHGKTAK
jgi:hypothetical protein